MTVPRTRVAVVDDDPSFCRALGRLLRASGFEVLLYSNAEEFLSRPAGESPDCAVLDIHMPGISGVELRQRLLATGSSTPVIFVTAHDEPAIRREAEAAGCAASFRKPVRGTALVAAIRAAVAPPSQPGPQTILPRNHASS